MTYAKLNKNILIDIHNVNMNVTDNVILIIIKTREKIKLLCYLECSKNVLFIICRQLLFIQFCESNHIFNKFVNC